MFEIAVLLAAVGVFLVAAGSYVLVSSWRFKARINALKRQLLSTQAGAAYSDMKLPEMVRAYAAKAGGRTGTAGVFYARQTAMLATSKTGPAINIKAGQWTGVREPGIVWRASSRMKGLPVSVLDAYVDGRGQFSVRILGAFQVAGGRGADYDKGEFMRYLSELPIYPDAILNARGLTWRVIDARTVEVTGRSATGPAMVRFLFDADGDIVGLEADDRPMGQDDGTTVPTAWHGQYGEYRQFGRYRIPSYGEVGWVLPEGLFTYWHGTLVAYEPAASPV